MLGGSQEEIRGAWRQKEEKKRSAVRQATKGREKKVKSEYRRFLGRLAAVMALFRSCPGSCQVLAAVL